MGWDGFCCCCRLIESSRRCMNNLTEQSAIDYSIGIEKDEGTRESVAPAAPQSFSSYGATNVQYSTQTVNNVSFIYYFIPLLFCLNICVEFDAREKERRNKKNKTISSGGEKLMNFRNRLLVLTWSVPSWTLRKKKSKWLLPSSSSFAINALPAINKRLWVWDGIWGGGARVRRKQDAETGSSIE